MIKLPQSRESPETVKYQLPLACEAVSADCEGVMAVAASVVESGAFKLEVARPVVMNRRMENAMMLRPARAFIDSPPLVRGRLKDENAGKDRLALLTPR